MALGPRSRPPPPSKRDQGSDGDARRKPGAGSPPSSISGNSLTGLCHREVVLRLRRKKPVDGGIIIKQENTQKKREKEMAGLRRNG